MTYFLAKPAGWLFVSGVLLAGSASGFGLQEAYRAALDNDPQYRAARHEREAGLQAEPMARAGLLPSLSFNAGATRYNGDRTISSGGTLNAWTIHRARIH